MKIIYVSDMDIKGSGYMNISVPLCIGLAEKGHELAVIGLGYKNEEHHFPFKLLAAKDFGEVYAMIHNLKYMWTPEVVLASLDIPWHGMVMERLMREPPMPPYIGIFPVESDPLCLEWAMILMQMSRQFTISQFGAEECQKMGVPAEHLQIGIDTESWRIPTPEEKSAIRSALGFSDEDYVILTIADNQERKNLGRAMQCVAEARKISDRPIKYMMVTREHNSQGYRLRSLASRSDIAINDILHIFERGMEFTKLWSMYAASDCFFLPSKAEGLGMPLLEAMACGVPCVATDCSGMRELLSDGRGILMPVHPDNIYPDVFGNSNRYMVTIQTGAMSLLEAMELEVRKQIIPAARAFVEKRNWQIAIDKMDETLRKL